jgi:hypothetical protein
VALTPGTLYALSNSDIHRLFKEWPDQFAILILNISRDLCRRLRAMNRLLAPGTGQVLRGEHTGV